MPSPHAHVPDDAGRSAHRESPYRASPVGLDDIDHLLEETAVPQAGRDAMPVRRWRDDLALVLDALRYARAVLAGDVAILRHALAREGTTRHTLVEELPSVLGSPAADGDWSEPGGLDSDEDLDPDLFTRADDLVSARGEMVGLDLSDGEEVARVLDLLEDTLVAVTAYQAAVELRLSQVRAVILRQYAEGIIPSADGSG